MKWNIGIILTVLAEFPTCPGMNLGAGKLGMIIEIVVGKLREIRMKSCVYHRVSFLILLRKVIKCLL